MCSGIPLTYFSLTQGYNRATFQNPSFDCLGEEREITKSMNTCKLSHPTFIIPFPQFASNLYSNPSVYDTTFLCLVYSYSLMQEQEARTAVLRDRAKRSRSQAVSAGNEAGDPSSVIQESRSEAKRSRSHAVSDQNEPGGPSSVIHEHHINFFSDLEEKVRSI